MAAGCFEALVDDLRALLRLAAGRAAEPSAIVLDSRTLPPSPESGERAGDDGAKRKRGSKIHMAVDTLGHLLALHVTPASADDRAKVERLAGTVQAVTGDRIEVAFVDQGYTGSTPAEAACKHGIELEVVKLPEAKRGFVLCHAVGLSNGPSPGQPASGASSRIASDTPQLLQVSTSSHSPASC
jgi:hypothetical protein